MTDMTPPPVGPGPEHEMTARGDRAPAPAGRRGGRKHPAARARIAAAGIGVGAMVGLASHMDVTFSRAQSANATTSSTAAATASHRALVAANGGTAARAVAAVKARRPIVLKVHAVVNAVNAPSTSGYVGSGYSASAAAPAAAPAPAAPVATTSGSTGGG